MSKPITFSVGDDTHAHIERFAAEQRMTVEEYMRSVAIHDVYEKLRHRRDFAAAQRIVEGRLGSS